MRTLIDSQVTVIVCTAAVRANSIARVATAYVVRGLMMHIVVTLPSRSLKSKRRPFAVESASN